MTSAGAIRVRVHLAQQPEREHRRQLLGELAGAHHVVPDGVAQRFERLVELAVPELVLVERVNRERHRLPCRLRAPLPPERYVLRIVEGDAERRSGSEATGAFGSSGTFMCSWSTIGESSLAIGTDHGRHRVLVRPGEQCPTGVGTGPVRQRRVVEQQLRERERVLVGGDALVLHVRAAVRRPEVALLQVESDVEQEQVEHHCRPVREIPVGRELDEREQRRDVLLVVDVGVPFGEAEPHLLVEPLEDAPLRRRPRARPRSGRRSRRSRP